MVVVVVVVVVENVHFHRIHVWYIYLHLVDLYGKCIVNIAVPWILCDLFPDHLLLTDYPHQYDGNVEIVGASALIRSQGGIP